MNTITSPNIQIPITVTGYVASDDDLAQRTIQGGRVHYSIALPLPRVPDVLPKPDPNTPFEDNRVVRPAHAKGFADYVLGQCSWHSGPLTVRTSSDTVEFVPLAGGDLGSVQIGILRVPRARRNSFALVDGQHRVLGIQMLLDRLGAELLEKSSRLQRAVAAGEARALLVTLQKDLDAVRATEARVSGDSILIDLIIENDRDRARQIFVDVADNALGINKTVTARFDMRKVVNRALNELMINRPELLKGRIDEQQNKVGGQNPNLIGANTVAEIIHIVQVGIKGRITAAQEKTLDARNLVARAGNFFDDLVTAFPALAGVVNGTSTVKDLRESSMLGSVTMLKVLAGVYHEVMVGKGRGRGAAAALLTKLAPHMAAPVKAGTTSGDLWLSAGTEGAFTDGAMAPGARAQQVKELVSVIAGWLDNPPAGL